MKLPSTRNAQIVGQVFIYVLGIVIMGAILIYGYNAISDFRRQSEQVSAIKLQSELSSAIDALSSDFGSIKKIELRVEGYSRICFVESHTTPSLDGLTIDPLIRDSIASGTGKNVFLLTNTVEASFTVESIAIFPLDVLCIEPHNNAVELRLEGKGDHVLLSNWQ